MGIGPTLTYEVIDGIAITVGEVERVVEDMLDVYETRFTANANADVKMEKEIQYSVPQFLRHPRLTVQVHRRGWVWSICLSAMKVIHHYRNIFRL